MPLPKILILLIQITPCVLCWCVFSCRLEVEETDEYGNAVCSSARQRTIHKPNPPARASLMLTFPSILPALQRCVSAAGLSAGSEFGCTASEAHVKGTINELCGVRGI